MAARAAREMVVYARRNGNEQQVSAMLRHRNHLSDTARHAQDHIEARFDGPLPITEIASRCGVSERTLTRRFTEATGLTPLRYQRLLRLERAEHLIGHGATVEAAARTVGFEAARTLRRLRARGPALRPPGPRANGMVKAGMDRTSCGTMPVGLRRPRWCHMAGLPGMSEQGAPLPGK